jgi:dTDP-4-dehydrorhamnose reductase
MKKILIFGSSGFLGSAFIGFLRTKKGIKLFLPKREKCDIINRKQLEMVFRLTNPDLVINCAANLNQDLIEEKPALGLQVNFLAVYYLVELCKKYESEFMHFGTTQDKEVTNIYSLTKRMANLIPELVGFEKYYLFRLGWLFGPNKKGKDFVNFIIKALENNQRLGLTNNRWGSPVYTKDLVKYCWKKYHEKNYGLFSVANKGRVTKWQIAVKISQILKVKHNFYINNNFKEISERCKDSSIKKAPLRPHQEALKEFLYGY